MEINGHQQMIQSDNVHDNATTQQKKNENRNVFFHLYLFLSVRFQYLYLPTSIVVHHKRQPEFLFRTEIGIGEWSKVLLLLLEIKLDS